MRLFQIAAPALFMLAAPVHAAVVTAEAQQVSLWGGDIVAEAYSLTSDDADFAPSFAMIAGGVTGFDPAFSLLIEDASGEVGYGETQGYSFDGDRVVSFLFDLTGAATEWLGETLALTLTFDQTLTDPFDDDADYAVNANWMMAEAVSPAPIPLPATLPMLAGALAVVGCLRSKRRNRAA